MNTNDWDRRAFRAFITYARHNERFTTECVHRSTRVPRAQEPKRWGQIALRAQAEGYVRRAGVVRAQTPSLHGAYVTLWESA